MADPTRKYTEAELDAMLSGQQPVPKKLSDMSDVELNALAAQHGIGEAQQAQPSSMQLKGGTSMNVALERDAEYQTKMLFPQPDDDPATAAFKWTMLMPQTLGLGAQSTMEDLENAALGGAQSLAGQQNITTIGDLFRSLPGAKPKATAGELFHSAAYNRQLQQNQIMAALANAGSFTGGVGVPIGGGSAGLSKLVPPQLARMIPSGLKRLAPMAASGAGWGAIMPTGAEIGQTHRMPNASQLATNAALGGGIGVGLHGAGSALGALLSRRGGAPPVAPQTQAAPQPSASLGNQWLERGYAPEAVAQNYKAMLTAAQAAADQPREVPINTRLNGQVQTTRTATKQPRTQQQIEATQQKLVQRASRYTRPAESGGSALETLLSGSGEDHGEYQKHVAEVRGMLAKLRLAQKAGKQKQAVQQANIQQKHTNTIEAMNQRLANLRELAEQRRGITQEQTALKAEAKASDVAEAEGKSGLQVSASGGKYRTLSDEIDSALDEEHLRAIEKEVLDPGQGMHGKRLLDGPQQKNLLDQVRRKLRTLKGEASASAESADQAPPTVAGVKAFLEGEMRKTLPAALKDPRTHYKVAVSPRALGEVAGFSKEEISALERWTGDLHEANVEIKVKQAELDRLIKWSLENADQLPSSPEITKDWSAGELILHKEGSLRNLVLNRAIESFLDGQHAGKVSLIRSKLLDQARVLEGGIREGERKASIATVVCGRAESHAATADGRLTVEGMAKIGPAQEWKAPRGLDDLYDRIVRNRKWVEHFQEKVLDIKEARGEYDHLGNGTTAHDLLQRAFNKQRELWKSPGEVPTARVWHADDFGYVSTTVYRQKSRTESFGDAAKHLDDQYKQIAGNILNSLGHQREVTSATWKTLGSSTHGFTGLEALPFAGLVAAKGVHKLMTNITRGADIPELAVGHIGNILKSCPEFCGPEVANRVETMLGQILDQFARDDGKLLSRIGGAEELTDLLNRFKGEKVTAKAYRAHAMKMAVAAGKTSPAELEQATKEAHTALFIRHQYREAAKFVKPLLDEMDKRAADLKSPSHLSPERSKVYPPSSIVNGKLSEKVYDKAFHTALQKMHDCLTLKGSTSDSMSSLIGRIASRKNASIFGGNVSTGVGNFFDAGVPTLLHFHKHWFKAAGDVMFNPELRKVVQNLPVVAQADMENAKFLEELRNRPETQNWFKKNVVYKYEDLREALTRKLDPFKGRERVVSLADRVYSRIGAVASIYKQADGLGMKGPELLQELLTGNSFTPAERAHVWKNVSEDLTMLYNSVAPNLYPDLMASSPVGKLLLNYQTPQRRTFRLYWDWMRSNKPSDQLKGALAMAGHIALSGRGAIPKSARAALIYGAAITGGAEYIETGMENLDDWNMLRKTSGLDLTDRMGFDVINFASPVLDGAQRMRQRRRQLSEMDPASAWSQAAFETFGETLSLIPRVGPVGMDVGEKLLKNVEAGLTGEKTYWFEVDGQLRSFNVSNYTVLDGLRDFALPGQPPQVFEEKQRQQMDAAVQSDAKKSSATNSMWPF